MQLAARRLTPRRLLFVFSFGLVMWQITVLEWDILTRVTERRRFFYDGYLFETPGCKFPSYDPFHWTIRVHYKNLSGSNEVVCNRSRDLVSFADRHTPVLNEQLLASQFNETAKSIACFYAEVLRNLTAPVPDNTTVYGIWRQVHFGQPLKGQYILIECYRVQGEPLFHQYAFLAKRKKSPGRGFDARTRRRKMNVLILGIDTTSRLATIRHLPRTRRYLKQELNAFELVGYNKVGKGSFENQIPLLTGFSGKAMNRLMEKIRHYDAVPHLMSVYRKRGYRTLFLEEDPLYGLFMNPLPLGFSHMPADYYPRAIMTKFARPTCSVLRYVNELLSSNEQAMFAYVWLSEMSHDDFNGVGHLDVPVESLLRNLSASGALSNTALLVMSDHGLRFGAARRTEVGREENKTPFCFLALPEHFLRRHPKAAVSLEVNQRRLVTAYDLHATLLTLADLPYFKPRNTDKGISLFKRVSPKRTCADASILPDDCACVESFQTPAEPATVRKLTRAVLAHINARASSGFPGKCSEWRLKGVDEAVLSTINGTQGEELHFSLTFRTTPEAYFDVRGSIPSAESAQDVHVDEIERLDAYEEQTRCLPAQHPERMVCSCKEFGVNLSLSNTWW
ncbi:uncharacterized protein LOC144096809 [Amblyomma americanum]